MYTNEDITKLFDSSIEIITKSKTLTDEIKTVIEKIHECLSTKNKIIIFGNGGSAADAQHMAAEFIGRFLKERDGIPAISLTTDTSIITSLGNDYGFEFIFSRQCESLVKKNDIVIAISTSGESKSVLNAVDVANSMGMLTVGFTGQSHNQLCEVVNYKLQIPSNETGIIQQGHITFGQMLCLFLEEKLFN